MTNIPLAFQAVRFDTVTSDFHLYMVQVYSCEGVYAGRSPGVADKTHAETLAGELSRGNRITFLYFYNSGSPEYATFAGAWINGERVRNQEAKA